MTLTIRQSVANYIWLALIAIAIVPPTQAQQRSNSELLASLSGTLEPVPKSDVKAATSQAVEALNRLRKELADQAIGVVLSRELRLDRLDFELRSELPDVPSLNSVERALRRILPGKVQQTTDALRAKVGALTRLLILSPVGLDQAQQSIATIGRHFQDERLRQSPVGESELRTAFAELTKYHISTEDIETLRNRLSIANYSSLVKKEFLESISKRSFELPIHFSDCKDRTSILGDGAFRVALSLELPPSIGESRLVVHATGTGQIEVSADRQRIHVGAQLLPRIQGQQSLHIRPSEISGDAPLVAAQLSTRLRRVNIDGLLGRLQLSKNLASRIIQNKLTENEKPVADRIERSARERVEEECFDIAYRINGLLRHGVWDRIHSVDFQPKVHLQNDSQGIRTETNWGNRNQLGALNSRPNIPPDTYRSLDLITWTHESAVNNTFDSLTGIRLDEATIRGWWETELKMTSDEWRLLPPARVPAAITLADQTPLSVRFVSQGVELRLRVKSCEIDGQVVDDDLRELTIFYRIENDAHGFQISRQPIVFPSGLSAEKIALWTKALDLFAGKTLRPAPRFRNSSSSSLLRVGYLNLDGGWLVIGTARALPPTGSSAQLLPDKVSR